jgi:tetratricopeptide (TPR) repeat protein
MQKFLILGMIALAVGIATIGVAADPNSVSLLRRGQVQLDAGDHAQAAEYLRLACFGLLDEPSTLAECLIPLALAYDGMDRDEDFRAVFERVVEVEERFAGYSAANLTSSQRGAFEASVKRHLPETMLVRIAAFSHLVPTEEDRIAAMSGSERRRFFEQRAEAEPNDPRWPVELARMDLAEGRMRRAERHLQSALAAAPDDPTANLEMARLEVDDQQWSAAARHFEASGIATDTASDAAAYLRALEESDRLEDIVALSLELGPDIAADPGVAAIVDRSTAELERREAEAQARAEEEALAAAAAAAAAAEALTEGETEVAIDEDDETLAKPTESGMGPAVEAPDELEPPDADELGAVRVVDLPADQVDAAEGTGPATAATEDSTPASTLVRVETQTLRDRSVVTLTFDGQIARASVAHWRLTDPPRHMIAIRGIGEKRVPYQVDFDGPRVEAVRSAIHTEKDPVEIHVVIDRATDDVQIDSVRVAGRVIMVDLSGGR